MRYLAGEKVEDICLSLQCSRSWLYKWLGRYGRDDPHWPEDQSRRPQSNPFQVPDHVEQAVLQVRLELSEQGLFCGAQAIHWQLEEVGIAPLPSLPTINRLLVRHQLIHRRTKGYQPKGKAYPGLMGKRVNQRHQADFVGPCYLHGPIRFYSLNSVDLFTGRCAFEPLLQRGGQHTLDAFWAIWQRLGMPDHQQVDNDMVFYGSPAHPRGMGSLIRLCLAYGIQVWFIPPAEPWRNGVIEKVNDHYRQKFLHRLDIAGEPALRQEALHFEQKHNRRYRYSKLGGKTPMQALATANQTLRFPPDQQAPRYPLSKPGRGKYHVVRFIRSDALLNVFGETFVMPPETVYEYVIATVDVAAQKLKVFLERTQVDEIDYPLF